MRAGASKTKRAPPLITNSHSGQREYIIQGNLPFAYINFQKSRIKVQKCMCITNRERRGTQLNEHFFNLQPHVYARTRTHTVCGQPAERLMASESHEHCSQR